MTMILIEPKSSPCAAVSFTRSGDVTDCHKYGSIIRRINEWNIIEDPINRVVGS